MLDNPIQFGSLSEFLVGVLNFATAIAFPIIVLFIVYIGFLFVLHSGSDPEKLKEDRKYLLWAIVGALIVLAGKGLALAIAATVTALGGG